MPIVTVTLTKGKPQYYIDKVSASITQALTESFQWPPDDLFHRFLQVKPGVLIYDRNYGGGPRSDDFMIIEFKSDPRQRHNKDDVFKAITEHLAKSPGVRPEDVQIILDTDSNHEDYSLGSGISANKY